MMPLSPLPLDKRTLTQGESISQMLSLLPYGDGPWLRHRIAGLPLSFQKAIMKQHLKLFDNVGRRNANLSSLEKTGSLPKNEIKKALNEDELRLFAKRRADECKRISLKIKEAEKLLLNLSGYAVAFGIRPPTPGRLVSASAAIARLCDEHWWRSSVRKIYGRQLEQSAISLGLVHRFAGIYASDETVRRRSQQRTTNNRLLSSLYAINEDQEEYTLKELSDLSVSNPAIRRAELMARISGFEETSKNLNHVSEFYTVTCPSRMHARFASNGAENPKYDGTTPREAHAYLQTVWTRIRAKLDRLSIRIYGFRVAEPQHDGTPHWHYLVFMEPEHVETVRQVFEDYALQEDGNEPGAKEHRFTTVEIDPAKGTATSYIAKYISKNIDGHGLESDLYGREAKSSAARVEAWASTWGIRQFQQFGGPPVGVWRELRRLSPDNLSGDLQEACIAADEGDWAKYTAVMGGPLATRKDFPITIQKSWSDKPGKYGDPVGYRTLGVTDGVVVAASRVHVWKVEHRPRGFSGDDNVTLRNVEGKSPYVTLRYIEKPPPYVMLHRAPAPIAIGNSPITIEKPYSYTLGLPGDSPGMNSGESSSVVPRDIPGVSSSDSLEEVSRDALEIFENSG